MEITRCEHFRIWLPITRFKKFNGSWCTCSTNKLPSICSKFSTANKGNWDYINSIFNQSKSIRVELMKDITFILLLISSIFANQTNSDVEEGLYYVWKGWFLPPNIIYANYSDSTFYVECFLVIKGTIQSEFADTLINNGDLFKGKYSNIYFHNNNIFFTIEDPGNFLTMRKIRNKKLSFSPDKMESYESVKYKAQLQLEFESLNPWGLFKWRCKWYCNF